MADTHLFNLRHDLQRLVGLVDFLVEFPLDVVVLASDFLTLGPDAVDGVVLVRDEPLAVLLETVDARLDLLRGSNRRSVVRRSCRGECLWVCAGVDVENTLKNVRK